MSLYIQLSLAPAHAIATDALLTEANVSSAAIMEQNVLRFKTYFWRIKKGITESGLREIELIERSIKNWAISGKSDGACPQIPIGFFTF